MLVERAESPPNSMGRKYAQVQCFGMGKILLDFIFSLKNNR